MVEQLSIIIFMSVYAVGDVQGCYDDLMVLLDHIHFNEQLDQLWFVGDLVNRGPKNLQTVRFSVLPLFTQAWYPNGTWVLPYRVQGNLRQPSEALVIGNFLKKCMAMNQRSGQILFQAMHGSVLLLTVLPECGSMTKMAVWI